MKIFVDAMGGDFAPQAPVEGAIEALRRYPQIEVVLSGVLPEIEKHLVNCDDVRSRITLLDAPEDPALRKAGHEALDAARTLTRQLH